MIKNTSMNIEKVKRKKIQSQENEIWKKIPGFKKYRVSNKGRVKSLKSAIIEREVFNKVDDQLRDYVLLTKKSRAYKMYLKVLLTTVFTIDELQVM